MELGPLVLMVLVAIVCFVMAWVRSNATFGYVGHAVTAFASLLAALGGGSWLSIAGIVVFVVNGAVLLVLLAREGTVPGPRR